MGLLFQIGLSYWSPQFALAAITTYLDMRQALQVYQADFIAVLAKVLTYDQCLRLLDFAGSEQWLADEDVSTSRNPFNFSVVEASSASGCALAARLQLTQEMKEYIVPMALVALTRNGAPTCDERSHMQLFVSVLLSTSHIKHSMASALYLQVRAKVCGQLPFNSLETNVLDCLLGDTPLHRTLQEPCHHVVIVPKYNGQFDRDFARRGEQKELVYKLMSHEQRRGMKRLRESDEIARDHSLSS